MNYDFHRTKLPDKFKIVYFGKEIKVEWHFFQTLPQRRALEKYHHLINPILYSQETIDRINKAMFDIRQKEVNNDRDA